MRIYDTWEGKYNPYEPIKIPLSDIMIKMFKEKKLILRKGWKIKGNYLIENF